MRDLTIDFTKGPLRGESVVVEIGEVVIGRQPGEGGIELKGASTAVSREHAEFADVDGKVLLRNRSPNGTAVDGDLVFDQLEIQSGAVIQIGDQFELEVSWASWDTETTVRPGDDTPSATKSGPLSSPIVRMVLVVYLGGIAAAGLWFGVFAGDAQVADDWPALQAAYQQYYADKTGEMDWQDREARAQILVRELRALRIQGHQRDSRVICRELMHLDKDQDSPLYRYGVGCLTVQ